jgi:H+-translocating NAD(P) transhydrogenase subunit alpha
MGSMIRVAVVKEALPNERRVALVPASLLALIKAGIEVVVESGAGVAAGFQDAHYSEKGATIVQDRKAAFEADAILQVRAAGANKSFASRDVSLLRRDQIVIAMCDPLGDPKAAQAVATTGARLFALELIPRITRAQSMDVLSSQATIAGYRAVLLAAMELDRIFPMMMTAAGTLPAAKVFVIGVGVAGLQAIASAKKLGAVVSAYDVRPACREQVESLGGRFVELKLEAGGEDKGGYAKAMDEDFYRRQGELLASVVAQSDVVITTAAIPGKKSPLLLTADAVHGMPPGGIIIDLAAERGGNCELTQADERVNHQGITILGPTNIASDVPQHASLMYSNNVTKFLLNLVKDGQWNLNMEDEIIRETLVTNQGEVVLPRVRELLADKSLST